MANKYFPRVIETSSNTPADSGTVSVSLSGTSPTMTFIGAGTSAGRLFDDVLASTETCLVHIFQTNDPSLWMEVQATFTAAAPDTLTFVAANVKDGSAGAGTLVTWTSTVTCEMHAGADTQTRNETDISEADAGAHLISTATAVTTGNITGVVGTYHVLTVSGMTADRDFVAPATAAVGDRVAVQLLTAAPAAYELVIKGNTGQTIILDTNESSAGAEITRLMIKGECLILRCTVADTQWVVEYSAMGNYTFSVRQNGNVASQQTLSTAAFDPIEGDVLNTTVYDYGNSLTNVGSAADVTFTARRAGVYLFEGLVIQQGGAASADKKVINAIGVNSLTADDIYILSRGYNSANNGVAGFGGSVRITLAVGDTVRLCSYAEEATTAVTFTDNYCLFSGRWECL